VALRSFEIAELLLLFVADECSQDLDCIPFSDEQQKKLSDLERTQGALTSDGK